MLKETIAMAKRMHNPRAAKIHRSYTVEQTAALYTTTKGTVRNWIKQGLKVCNKQKPILIHGADLNEFHAEKRHKNKRPCSENEIFCMRCREPRHISYGLVEFERLNEKTGNLKSICPVCSARMFKGVNFQKLKLIAEEIGLTFTEDQLHIIDTQHPSVNDNLMKGKNHA